MATTNPIYQKNKPKIHQTGSGCVRVELSSFGGKGKDMACTTPPRNVIYFSSNANQISLAGIGNLPYTDVIIGFLVPNNNLELVGAGGAFDDNLQSNIRALQNAGKNVLISFGGATFPAWPTQSCAYQSYAQNVNGLVNQLFNFVTSNGFNGVDIDYEDDAGFTGVYDGIGFLTALTSGLAQALPSGQNIITHASQTPYWDSNFHNAPYAQIWQRVSNQITWINNQFYHNPDYDRNAATKVSSYRNIVAITGSEKLLVGVPLDPGIEGFISLDDMIQNVIRPLQSNFGAQFGGTMGWEFAFDQGGAWGMGIGQALDVMLACPGQSYTVVAGDTLYTIAQWFLGTGNLWAELTKPDGTPFTEAEAEDLPIGQVVCIPGQQASR
jgi:chitinase